MPDQVVLITGAHGGLGTHVCRRFLDAGARTVGTSLRIAAGDFAHEHFTAKPADLLNSESVKKMVADTIGQFGGIDALVHVAGGFAYGGPIHETGDDVWEQMWNLNFRAAVNILRAVIPGMRERKRGRIVAIGSRAGVEPAANIAAYAASKAALVSLIQTAALENKSLGITANVILPGTIDTAGNRKADPNADTSKWVPPQNLAELAFYLTTDAAAQITGAAIPVYGSAL